MKKMLAKIMMVTMMVFSSFAMVSLVPASALASNTEVQSGLSTVKGNFNSNTNLESIVSTVIKTMLFIVGVLSVIMIIYAGIRYVTAHGDKDQIKGAQNTLVYAIAGLVIAILAYAIVNFVVKLF